MAQLYFKYGAMGSSKTANALMARFNYEERGQKTLLCKPQLDTRDGDHMVHSRIGLEYPCVYFHEMRQMDEEELKKNACIIVDEAQFLTKEEVLYLVHLVDDCGIPVICSRNPNFEIDIDKEEIGITVEYNDVQGWIDAIRYIADHPEEARRMGENARKLAEERFNLEIFSREIAESLLEISNISSKNRTFA